MMEARVDAATDYASAIAELVSTMPPARAAQVYDFARFLQSQPAGISPLLLNDDGWLDDSEEQMEAEDARWNATFARHQEQFAALEASARAEIEAGLTMPLFDNRGELTL